ncbi:p33K [Mastadenovirus porcusquartum]|uniref:33 kDa protein n=1 Tax=Mastadenovirus porcusquartum TaxID=3241439 RepID=A0A5P9VI50_9ADEN|nr:p33K [Porcine mastadenovirus B]QFX65720.1 p33K [Porcine mastadenovirus B]QNQ79222.1 33 kDa protein [Porcine mastadenovirus B]QNQ79257.1 33 kDa protein [Porcine mastadenovirus B]
MDPLRQMSSLVSDHEGSESETELSLEEGELRTPEQTPKAKPVKKRRWDLMPEDAAAIKDSFLEPAGKRKAHRQPRPRSPSPRPDPAIKALQNQIFPTLYTVFQQIQAQGGKQYTVRNRTFRSLVKSCLYHQSETQLRRTLEDADKLFQKYCGAARVQDSSD